MAITDLVTGAINPYLVYIKIALVVLAVSVVLGGVLYVKKTFNDKEKLIAEKAQLEFTLSMEKQKVIVAMEQLKIWQDTVTKMNSAIKNIKIDANTYIQGIENEPPPNVANGATVPFVMSGMSARSTLPRFETISSGRKRPPAP